MCITLSLILLTKVLTFKFCINVNILSIYNLYVEKGCLYIEDTDVGACVVLSEDIPRLGIGTRPLNVLHAWPCTTKVIDR